MNNFLSFCLQGCRFHKRDWQESPRNWYSGSLARGNPADQESSEDCYIGVRTFQKVNLKKMVFVRISKNCHTFYNISISVYLNGLHLQASKP